MLVKEICMHTKMFNLENYERNINLLCSAKCCEVSRVHESKLTVLNGKHSNGIYREADLTRLCPYTVNTRIQRAALCFVISYAASIRKISVSDVIVSVLI